VTIDRARLRDLLRRERARFADLHPRSAAAYAEATATLFGGVPMTWMNKAAGGFPLFLSGARGAYVRDIDDRQYVDFALGDTGAMAGHSPAATVEAVRRRIESDGGITAMMPTEDAAVVGAELGAASACRCGRSPSPRRTRTAGSCASLAR
jgi:glutamate-1-semialdehyde 2,1-aminomutase